MTADREQLRIQKIIAVAGIASRRAAEGMIRSGRVTLGGRRAKLGDRAVPGEPGLCVDGIPVTSTEERYYFALNKPAGVLSTASDPRGRPTVLDLAQGRYPDNCRLFPVGRLDKDSSGLILLTNDGFLTHRLMHPGFEVQREYMVEVEPVPSAGALARLRRGIALDDGVTAPARVSLAGRKGSRGLVRMVIHTGKKRQIRRSFEKLGCRVLSLHRVRIGPLAIGRLGPGDVRELGRDEVRSLYRATGIEETPPREKEER